MAKWKRKTDFCIAMGTSLCGMSADDCVVQPAKRYQASKQGNGSVIVGLQRTQYDDICSLRIFAKIDTVIAMLMNHLSFSITPFTAYNPDLAPDSLIGPDQYKVPYDEEGKKSDSKFTVWDLREGQKMVVVAGPGE